MQLKNSSVRASMEFSGPLNAVSVSQNQKLIAVGGRDVLKIVAIEATGFVEKRNLRSTKANLNFSTNDIRWHPQSDSILATAATNGFLVLWDIQRDSKLNKREFKAHERAVNRICWHPSELNTLLSASQDGLIKLWDQRFKGRNINTFQLQKSESVRDVKFSPFDESKFAAAFENGTIEIWDMRSNKLPEKKFPAHQGHILSLDWHPSTRNIIATGSRDRSVKVWDLTEAQNKPIQSIALIANAGRIQWRPNNPDHIASSSSITDSRINVWDIQKPYVPLACMQGHADIVSDFEWFDTPILQQTFGPHDGVSEIKGCEYWQHVVACSKDKTLKLHSLADAVKPHQSMHTVALSLNISGCIVSSHDTVDRTCPSLNVHEYDNPFSSLFNVQNESLTMQQSPPKVKSAANLAPTIPRISSFKVPTKRNASTGSLITIPSHQSVDTHVSSTSDIASTVPQGIIQVNSFHCAITADELKSILNGSTSIQSHIIKEKASADIYGFNEQVFRFLAASYELYGLSLQQMCTHNAKVAATAGSLHLSKSWKILQLLYEKKTNVLYRKDALNSDCISSTQWTHQHDNSNQTSKLLAQLDEVNPMQVYDGYPFDETTKETKQDVIQVQSHGKRVDISRIQDKLLKELLDYYSEAGDVQSCTSIAAAMSNVTNIEALMGKGWLQQVYMHYIDLLHQLQLYSVANYLVKNCPDVGIRQMNMKATTIYTSCSKCNKPIDHMPPKLAKLCQKALCAQCFNITRCSICQLPASGLFVWCPVCCHGGHLQHMQEWFATEQVCPTGCSHSCAPFLYFR